MVQKLQPIIKQPFSNMENIHRCMKRDEIAQKFLTMNGYKNS